MDCASRRRLAFSKAAFSRSSSPTRPKLWESVNFISGLTSRRISAARSSHSEVSGEKTATMATESIPSSWNLLAAWRISDSFRGMKGRPSYSCPPSTIMTLPRTWSAKSFGQSANGGSAAPLGSPIRSAPMCSRSRRWTTAFVKCVVPMTTPSSCPASPSNSSSRAVKAETIPDVTSSLVGLFTAASTRFVSTSTASVFVPPTSTPMRLTFLGPQQRQI